RKASEQLGLMLSPETADVILAHLNDERLRSDLITILRHFYRRGMTDEKGILEAAWRQGRLAIVPKPESDNSATTLTAATVMEYPGEVFRHLEYVYLPGFRLSRDRAMAYADLARQI